MAEETWSSVLPACTGRQCEQCTVTVGSVSASCVVVLYKKCG